MCLMLDQFLWGHPSRVCDISCYEGCRGQLLSVRLMSLKKTLYPLLSTGSTQEAWKLSWHDWKLVDFAKLQQHKQTVSQL